MLYNSLTASDIEGWPERRETMGEFLNAEKRLQYQSQMKDSIDTAMVSCTLVVFVCAQWYPTHIVLCFCLVYLRLVYPMLPGSLDLPFLIAHSVFSNVNLIVSYFCRRV